MKVVRLITALAGGLVLGALRFQVFDRGEASAEAQAILDLAEGLTVEYRADVLFRLMDAGKGPGNKDRPAVLEALFQSAVHAKEPVAVHSIAPGTPTHAGLLVEASRLGLDRTSIRCRIVRELAKTDREKARRLFREVYRDLGLVASGCESPLVFDPSLLEITLREMLVGLKGEALAEQLSDYANSIVSGVQVPGLVQLLLNHLPAGGDHGLLFAVSSILSGRLQELRDGDRTFVQAVGYLRLIERVAELAGHLRQGGLGDEMLWRSLRRYLKAHLTAERCADTVQPGRLEWRSPAEIRALFNDSLKAADSRTEPLTEQETRPSRLVTVSPPKQYYLDQAADCVRALSRLHEEDPSGERRSEWISTLDRCFSAVRTLVPASKREETEIFHQKAAYYVNIFDMAPAWWDPRAGLEEWLALLENSPLKTESPMEWLWELQIFLNLARELSEERRAEFERLQKKGVRIPGLPGPHRQAIWERVRGSKEPVVALYGMLEAVAPLKWGAWRAR